MNSLVIYPTKLLVSSIILFLFFQFNLAFGQGTIIEFESPEHNFGTVKEEDGSVVYEFKFTNKGMVPAIIVNVQASCGCTTPEWSKDPVLPGQTGFIKAEYNPINRPGVFEKTLTVTANTEPPTTILKIKGMVSPKPKLNEYADTIGYLRMPSRVLNFGNITTKEPVSKDFKIYNDGKTPIVFSNPSQLPKFLRVEFVPSPLPPKSTGMIKITYDAKLKNDFGLTSDALIIPTNDEKQPKKILSVTATITEHFPEMSPEQLENAPKIEFDKVSYDFGDMKEGSVASCEFLFTNKGKDDLIIRKVKGGCTCLAASASRNLLKPGESSRVKVSYNTRNRNGKESKSVVVFSNDPTNSSQVLTVQGNILK